jgi:hypothetical protein
LNQIEATAPKCAKDTLRHLQECSYYVTDAFAEYVYFDPGHGRIDRQKQLEWAGNRIAQHCHPVLPANS